ncbi:hypothetical protein BpHYR1_012219 [Brachionus plicatilis]|uniref:Uncharacterized protein n=1 Tax=Brachionus plicatilis TaxID=10195 RepID=A0A3M7P2Z3_BRAPC|nr:hypothetical protein BpHYR1_012219 [Brachionus plicatilis]
MFNLNNMLERHLEYSIDIKMVVMFYCAKVVSRTLNFSSLINIICLFNQSCLKVTSLKFIRIKFNDVTLCNITKVDILFCLIY